MANYDYKEDKKALDKLLTECNWSEWSSKFMDRVAGCNIDLLYLLKHGFPPAELLWDRDDPNTMYNRPMFSRMMIFEKSQFNYIC